VGGVGIVFVDPVGPVLVEKPLLGFTRIYLSKSG